MERNRGRRRDLIYPRQAEIGLGFPALTLTVLFTLVPLAMSSLLVFQRTRGFGEVRWVGFENFRRIVFEDPAFWNAIGRTFLFTAGTTVGTVVIGMALALAFHRRMPGSRALKFLAFLPVILPPTFYALAWRYGLDPIFGWFNTLLARIEPELVRPWLTDPSVVLWVVTIIGTIQYVGIPMILFGAALSDIPGEIEDAARVDGVNSWQMTWQIILPMARDVVVVVVAMQLIANFKWLDMVWALTKGGPGMATDVLATFVYREAFVESNLGYGSAAALIGTIIIVIASLLYNARLAPRRMSSS